MANVTIVFDYRSKNFKRITFLYIFLVNSLIMKIIVIFEKVFLLVNSDSFIYHLRSKLQ